MKNLTIATLCKLAVFSLSILIFATSCSDSKKIPQPPHLKTQLITELFSALRHGNYEIALNRLDRLKELNQEDVALQSIQTNVQNNLVMQRAQNALNKGNVDGAIGTINNFTAKNGQTTDLRDSTRQLSTLKDIKVLIDNAYSQTNLSFMSRASTQTKKTLTQKELLGLEDLKADIDLSWVKGDENIDTLFAIIEVEDPSDSIVSYYKKSMSDDWNKIDVSKSFLVSNAEVLVFRNLAATSFDKGERAIIRRVTSYSPNSYSDMLSKAIMLNFINDIENSNIILRSMKSELNVSNDIYDSWFNFIPKNISLDTINPLATKPFFVYCNRNALIKAQ